MIEPQLTENEDDRLEALCALNILNTPQDERFDRITRLAAAMFGVPMALVSLVDNDRQWFKSQHGVDILETPRSISFCSHAIHDSEPFIVPDATLDERFQHNPLVIGAPYMRFYAGYPILGPYGHPLGTLCIIDTRPRRADEIDITSLRDLAKLVEEEIGKALIAQRSVDRRVDLNEALQQLSLHVHNSPLAVVQWNHSLHVTEWSSRAEEMFSWGADDVVDKHLDELRFIHEADRETARDTVLELIHHQVLHNTTLIRLHSKDGSIVTGRWHNSARFDRDGIVTSVVSLVEDISAQIAAEAELRESLATEIDKRRKAETVLLASEERIRTIVKSSHDAFIGIDSKGMITDWNAAAETTFGWTSNETVGRDVADIIIPPRNRDVHLSGLQLFLDSPFGTMLNNRIEMPALTQTGEEIPVEMTISSYRIGGAIYFGAFVHDISERKRAAKELSEKQNLLDAVLETIDVAVVACAENGELTLLNRAAREIHAVASERSLPNDWSSHHELFSADGKTLLQIEDIPLHRALQGKIVKDVEIAIAAKDLSLRYLLASGRQMVGAKGEKLGAVVAMNDITERKVSDRLLMQSEERLRSIAENLPAMIAHVDKDEKFIFVNRRAARYFGKEPEKLIGVFVNQAYGEIEYAAIKPYIDLALGGTRTSFESEFIVKNTTYHFQLNYDPSKDEAGVVTGFYAVAFDITDRKKSELRQAESEERLRTITDSLPVLISYIDKEERYRFANATYTSWFGFVPADMIGVSVKKILGSEIYEQRSDHLKRALAGEAIRFEMDVLLKGNKITVDTQYLPHRKDGVIEGVYTLTSDVTSAKEVEKQLYLLARIDALTELPNRRGFNEHLHDAVKRCSRSGKSIALMLMDIDHFKHINDTLGHAAGDIVLKEFADRLQNLIRSTDRVSRLAGDEFTIILEDVVGQDTVQVIVSKILERIRQPFNFDQSTIDVTTSIGIAFLHAGDADTNRLTLQADAALYAAKAAGRNQVRFSDS